MRYDRRIFCNEADTVSLSYTPCYVRMASHCHQESYVVAEPFTYMLVFFYVRFHDSSQPISRSHAKRTTSEIYDRLYDGIRENARNKQNFRRRHYFV